MNDVQSPPEQYRIDYLNVLRAYQKTDTPTSKGALDALSNSISH